MTPVQKKNIFVAAIVLILVCLLLGMKGQMETFREKIPTKEEVDQLVQKALHIASKAKESFHNFPAHSHSHVMEDTPVARLQPVSVVPVLQRDPRQMNALDRIYNPLRYPYKSDWYYERDWYPDQQYSPQVVGCGGRNLPCGGGSQTIIPNFTVPVDVSERNIAPVTVMPIQISTQGPLGEPQQVGVIMKIFGNENTVYPLFGRRKYPRRDFWEYYTTVGPFGAKVPILRQRQSFQTELQTNDVVMIQGQNDQYRVTIYETDFPQYIPYA